MSEKWLPSDILHFWWIFAVKHGDFDRLSKIYVGGSAYDNNRVQDAFDGIIGGQCF